MEWWLCHHNNNNISVLDCWDQNIESTKYILVISTILLEATGQTHLQAKNKENTEVFS